MIPGNCSCILPNIFSLYLCIQDKDGKKKSKLASKSHKPIIERSLFIKSQEQQQKIVNLTESVKSTIQRSPNKVLEQLQCKYFTSVKRVCNGCYLLYMRAMIKYRKGVFWYEVIYLEVLLIQYIDLGGL